MLLGQRGRAVIWHRACNREVPGSSPALTVNWRCFSKPQFNSWVALVNSQLVRSAIDINIIIIIKIEFPADYTTTFCRPVPQTQYQVCVVHQSLKTRTELEISFLQ